MPLFVAPHLASVLLSFRSLLPLSASQRFSWRFPGPSSLPPSLITSANLFLFASPSSFAQVIGGLVLICKWKTDRKLKSLSAPNPVAPPPPIPLQPMHNGTVISNGTTTMVVGAAYDDTAEESEENEDDIIMPAGAAYAQPYGQPYAQPIYDNSATPSAYQSPNPTQSSHYYHASTSSPPPASTSSPPPHAEDGSNMNGEGDGGAGQTKTVDPFWHEGYAE